MSWEDKLNVSLNSIESYGNMNQSNGSHNQEFSDIFESVLLAVKIMVTVSTVGLNTIIWAIILFMMKRRIYSNYLFLSISTSDLLVGAISLSSMTIYSHFDYWPYGYSLCIFWIVNDFSCTSISIYSLLILTVHRYFQMRFPLKTTENFTRFRIFLILFIWLTIYFGWTLSAILITRDGSFEIETCYFTYTLDYVLVADFCAFIFPIFLLIVFNVLTSIQLYKNNKKFAKRPLESKSTTNSPANVQDPTSKYTHEEINIKNHNSQTRSPASRFKRDIKAFICILVVTITLIACWAIFILAWPLSIICPTCISPQLYAAGYWTAYINSTLNPIILFVFHSRFRRKLKKLLRSIFKINIKTCRTF